MSTSQDAWGDGDGGHCMALAVSTDRKVFVVLCTSLCCFCRRRRRGCCNVRQYELGQDHAREAVILVVRLVRTCAVMGQLN